MPNALLLAHSDLKIAQRITASPLGFENLAAALLVHGTVNHCNSVLHFLHIFAVCNCMVRVLLLKWPINQFSKVTVLINTVFSGKSLL